MGQLNIDLGHSPFPSTLASLAIMDECVEVFQAGAKYVRLKENTLPRVKIREWTIDCVLKNGKLLLRCPEGKYTLEVMPEDVMPEDPEDIE